MHPPWSTDDWRNFVSRYWERQPTKMLAPAWAQFCSLPELFDIILASNGSERLASDRFWVARTENPKRRDDFVMVSMDLLGPQSSDGDLNGFFTRMRGRSFGINLHRLDHWRSELRERLREPMDQLGRLTEMTPIRRWDIDCFLGTYRMTPFGVHSDRASVFSLCLQGERTYLTWPPEYPWPEEDLFVPDEKRLEKHLDAAERFRVGPGELFYWPSNRWHVVCSNGQPSCVAQFSAYLGSNRAARHATP